MGRDTFVDIGVSVSLEFTFENILYIKTLLDEIFTDNDDNYEAKLLCYITGSEEYDDEFIEIVEFLENEEKFHGCLVLNNVVYSSDNTDFKADFEKYKPKKPIVLRFLFQTFVAYAINISRREIPFFFSDTFSDSNENSGKVSVSSAVNNLNEGLEYFRNLGIPEDMIFMGYTFSDCY